MIGRIIAPEIFKCPKSVLLLGPRQVGKSTLMQQFKPDLTIDLANEIEFLTHSSQPDEIRRLVTTTHAQTIFVDEVQRLPKILNTIQTIIDKDKKKFYLTGSSARKLRRGRANLLPGRVVNFNLGPLVSAELDYKMNTQKILEYGSLPEIYLIENQHLNKQVLQAYAAIYLQEEIKAESLTRNLESFARFLQEAIMFVGQFVDYTKLAKKAKLSRHAVPRFFEILEDTMVAKRIWPLECDPGLELIRHPKFYFFDNGVYNGLLHNFTASRDRIGPLAEQLVLNQLQYTAWAREKEIAINSFRTRQGAEVDFVIKLDDFLYAIEVKSSDDIGSSDLAGLEFFAKNISQVKGLFLLHMGQRESKLGAVHVLPWQKGLKELGL